jgi:hypothetical protein
MSSATRPRYPLFQRHITEHRRLLSVFPPHFSLLLPILVQGKAKDVGHLHLRFPAAYQARFVANLFGITA